MADPAFAENLFAEAVEVPVRSLAQLEGMGACPQSDDRYAPMVGIHKVFHVLIGPVAEPKGYDYQVRGVHCFRVGDALLVVGINFTLVIDRKENGAVESVVIGEDTAEHGKALLGTVFLVTADENNVLSLAGAALSLVVDR